MSRPRHDSLYKHFEVVQQIDIVPTLSALFDLGIPRCAAHTRVNPARVLTTT